MVLVGGNGGEIQVLEQVVDFGFYRRVGYAQQFLHVGYAALGAQENEQKFIVFFWQVAEFTRFEVFLDSQVAFWAL